jgi:hypothetical protein
LFHYDGPVCEGQHLEIVDRLILLSEYFEDVRDAAKAVPIARHLPEVEALESEVLDGVSVLLQAPLVIVEQVEDLGYCHMGEASAQGICEDHLTHSDGAAPVAVRG